MRWRGWTGRTGSHEVLEGGTGVPLPPHRGSRDGAAARAAGVWAPCGQPACASTMNPMKPHPRISRRSCWRLRAALRPPSGGSARTTCLHGGRGWPGPPATSGMKPRTRPRAPPSSRSGVPRGGRPRAGLPSWPRHRPPRKPEPRSCVAVCTPRVRCSGWKPRTWPPTRHRARPRNMPCPMPLPWPRARPRQRPNLNSSAGPPRGACLSCGGTRQRPSRKAWNKPRPRPCAWRRPMRTGKRQRCTGASEWRRSHPPPRAVVMAGACTTGRHAHSAGPPSWIRPRRRGKHVAQCGWQSLVRRLARLRPGRRKLTHISCPGSSWCSRCRARRSAPITSTASTGTASPTSRSG